MKKNAREQLQCACNQLQSAEHALTQAMSTVEKPHNKQEIEKTLNSVQNTLSVAHDAMTNYRD